MTAPTPKSEWVKEGDRCTCILPEITGQGTVRKVTRAFSIPHVTVQWDVGMRGNHTITILRKVA